MSHSFRPVKEIWNMHSSCFVEPEESIALLHDLAARVGTASEEHGHKRLYEDQHHSGQLRASQV
jgi:hypothetical protein